MLRPEDGYRLPVEQELRDAARRVLGDAELRADQAAALAAVRDADALVVLAPAAGKTAVYAAASGLLGGPTVVVSPTLSLQRDQVAALRGTGLTAAALNSRIGGRRRRQILADFQAGRCEFLLAAAEQLARADIVEVLATAGPALLVVDEAHCVYDWGPDFRPDYLGLAAAVRALGRPRVLAMTATASAPAREEICELLGIPQAALVVRGVDRPNIHLAVRLQHDAAASWKAVGEAVAEHEGSGIVYVTSRRHAEDLAARLREQGESAGTYHGRMRAADRDRIQDAFLTGGCRVVVATSAFGMGIDKPDVRFVLHADTPPTMEAYHQEVGRGGRDGEPADAVLFHRPGDLATPALFASGADADAGALAAALTALRERGALPVAEVAAAAGLARTVLTRAAPALTACGGIRLLTGRRWAAGPAPGPVGALADRAAEVVARRRERQRGRVELVRRYAQSTGCRRRTLLELLGESRDEPCGYCDNCEAGRPGDPGSRAAGDPAPGQRVDHPEWGRGVVQTVENHSLVVLFDAGGYRTLSLPAVREGNLLRLDP